MGLNEDHDYRVITDGVLKLYQAHDLRVITDDALKVYQILNFMSCHYFFSMKLIIDRKRSFHIYETN